MLVLLIDGELQAAGAEQAVMAGFFGPPSTAECLALCVGLGSSDSAIGLLGEVPVTGLSDLGEDVLNLLLAEEVFVAVLLSVSADEPVIGIPLPAGEAKIAHAVFSLIHALSSVEDAGLEEI